MNWGTTSPSWSIIVPTLLGWRGALRHTADSIEELAIHSGAQLILVVDGTTLPPEASRHPWTTHLTGGGGGFAAACNLGLSQARGDKVLFLNDDVEVPVSLLEELAVAWDRPAPPGVVVPDVLSVQLGRSESGCLLNSRFGLLESTQVRLRPEIKPHYPCGAAVAVDAQQFRRLGGWEEMYGPGYWEDVDLGLTLRATALDIVVVHHSTVQHLHGKTIGTFPSTDRAILFERNRILCSVKHCPSTTLPFLLAFLFPRILHHGLHGSEVARGSVRAVRDLGMALEARRRLRKIVLEVGRR